MVKYELTLIFKPNLKDKEQKEIIEKLKKILGSKKIGVDFWGKKKLAYEIQKQKEGVYCLFSFEASPEVLPELEKKIKLEENIVRYLIVRTS